MFDMLHDSRFHFALVSSDAEGMRGWDTWAGQAGHVGQSTWIDPFPELKQFINDNTSGIAIFGVRSGKDPASMMKHELAHLVGIHETNGRRMYFDSDRPLPWSLRLFPELKP